MNKTVLITGGSSGIGLELAKIFAKDGYNLILVAIDMDKLNRVAEDLIKNNIKVTVISKDLSQENAVSVIYKEIKDKEIVVDVLVNNAGFGTSGEFVKIDWEEERKELQVNIVALTELSKLFGKEMKERGEGKILNVASTAAFLPGPLMAVYYASKAYVRSFSEGLAKELESSGVVVSVLCPGPTETGFSKRAELENSRLFNASIMSASEVAKVGYGGLVRGERVIVVGWKNWLVTKAINFVPRSLVLEMVYRLQRSR